MNLQVHLVEYPLTPVAKDFVLTLDAIPIGAASAIRIRDDAWGISKIRISSDENRGKGYGSHLLEEVCHQLWALEPLPIYVQPGLPGFSREPNLGEALEKYGPGYLNEQVNLLCQWYARHGFQELQGPKLKMFQSGSRCMMKLPAAKQRGVDDSKVIPNLA